MADTKKPAPTAPLVDETTLTTDQLRDKLEESRAEAKKLNGILSRNKETIDSLGKQYNEQVDKNEALVDENESLKEKLKKPFQTNETSGGQDQLPSQKEIYLALVQGIAPELSSNQRGITPDQLIQRIAETAKHTIGLSQVLHKATTEKFLYRK